MTNILIAEDDEAIAHVLKIALGDAGFDCWWAADGRTAADMLDAESFDLALLDIMLPKFDGYDLLAFAQSKEVPVIFITARDALDDRVRGLRMGAQDYITKPFELMELLARVDVVLRRYGKASRLILIEPDIEIDTAARTVTRAGSPVALTNKEYDLLLLFARNRGVALYRDRIYERVWGESERGDSRTVDLHVQRVRRKLGLGGRLVSVQRIGYRLDT